MGKTITQAMSWPAAPDCPGMHQASEAHEAAHCERVRQSMGLTALRDNYNQLLQEFADWSAGSNRQQGRLSSGDIGSSDSGPDIAPHEHLDSQPRQHTSYGSSKASSISNQSNGRSSKHSSRHSSKQNSSKSTPGPSPRQLLKVQGCCDTLGAVGCLHKSNASSTQLYKMPQVEQPPDAIAASAQQQRAPLVCSESAVQDSCTQQVTPARLQQPHHQHTLNTDTTDQQPKAAVVAAAYQQHANAEPCEQLPALQQQLLLQQQQKIHKRSSLASVGAFDNVLGAVKGLLGHKKPCKQQLQASAAVTWHATAAGTTAVHATAAGTAAVHQGCQLSIPDAAESKPQEHAAIGDQCSSAQTAGSEMASDEPASAAPAAETICCRLHEPAVLQLSLLPRKSATRQNETQQQHGAGTAAVPVKHNQQQQQAASTRASKHSSKTPRQSRIPVASIAASAMPPSKTTEHTTNASLPAAPTSAASCKTVVAQPDTAAHNSNTAAQSNFPLHPTRKDLRKRVKGAGSTSVGSTSAAAVAAGQLGQPQQVAAVGDSTVHAWQQASRVPLLPLHQLQESTPAAAQPAGHVSIARTADGSTRKSEPSTAYLHCITANTTRRMSCPDGDEPSASRAREPGSDSRCQAKGSMADRRPSISCAVEAQPQLQLAPIHAVDSSKHGGTSSSSALTARAGSENRPRQLLAGNATADVQQDTPDTLYGSPASTPCDPLQHIKQLQMMRRRSMGLAVDGATVPDPTPASSSGTCSAAPAAAGTFVLLPAISGAMTAAATAAVVARTGHHCLASSSGSGTSGNTSVVSTPRSITAVNMPGAPTGGSRRTSSTQLQPLEEKSAVPCGARIAQVMLPPVAAGSAASSRRGSKTDDNSTSGVAGQGLTRDTSIQQTKALTYVESSVSKEYSLSSILSSSSCISCGDSSGNDAGPGLTYEPSNFGVCSNNPAGAVQLHRPPLIGKLEKLKNRLSSRHLVLEADAQPQPQQQQQPTPSEVRTVADAAVPMSTGADSLHGVSELALGASNVMAQADRAAAPVMAAPATVGTGPKQAVHHGRSLSGSVDMSQHATAACSSDATVHHNGSSYGSAAFAVDSRVLNCLDSRQQHTQQRCSQANQTAAPVERIRARWQVPQQQQQQQNRPGHHQDVQYPLSNALQQPGLTRVWSCRQPTAQWELAEQQQQPPQQQPVQHHGKLGVSHSFNVTSLQQRQQFEHAPVGSLAGKVQQLLQQPSMPEQQWQPGQPQWSSQQPLPSQQKQNWQQILPWQQQHPCPVPPQRQQQQHWQQQLPLPPPVFWPPLQPQQQPQPSTLPPLACMPAAVCRNQQHLSPLPVVDGRRQVVEPLSSVHTIPPGTAAVAVSPAGDWPSTNQGPISSGPTAATVAAVAALSATAVAVAGTAGGFMAPVHAHGALSRFTDPRAERQQQQSQHQQLQQRHSLQHEAVVSTELQEPAASQQLLPPVTTSSAAAMARQRQEMQQQAFEGLSLEAVLKTAKKIKPAASRRRTSLIDPDAVPATADNAAPGL